MCLVVALRSTFDAECARMVAERKGNVTIQQFSTGVLKRSCCRLSPQRCRRRKMPQLLRNRTTMLVLLRSLSFADGVDAVDRRCVAAELKSQVTRLGANATSRIKGLFLIAQTLRCVQFRLLLHILLATWQKTKIAAADVRYLRGFFEQSIASRQL